MPFSLQFEYQFIDIANDAITRVKFETKEDIALFCQNARLKLTNPEQVSPSKYDEDINELQELIQDGFDLYVTDRMVDQVNRVDRTLEAGAGSIEIPFFTPERELEQNNASEVKEREIKISREDRISEARAEFKKIIINQITFKLKELSSMNESQQTQYIENQRNKKREAEEKHRIMAAASAIPRSPESQTITEDEWMRRENPPLAVVRARYPGLFFNIAAPQQSTSAASRPREQAENIMPNAGPSSAMQPEVNANNSQNQRRITLELINEAYEVYDVYAAYEAFAAYDEHVDQSRRQPRSRCRLI